MGREAPPFDVRMADVQQCDPVTPDNQSNGVADTRDPLDVRDALGRFAKGRGLGRPRRKVAPVGQPRGLDLDKARSVEDARRMIARALNFGTATPAEVRAATELLKVMSSAEAADRRERRLRRLERATAHGKVGKVSP